MPLGTTLGIRARRADLITAPASAVNGSRQVAMAGAAMEGLSGLDVPLSLPVPLLSLEGLRLELPPCLSLQASPNLQVPLAKNGH